MDILNHELSYSFKDPKANVFTSSEDYVGVAYLHCRFEF